VPTAIDVLPMFEWSLDALFGVSVSLCFLLEVITGVLSASTRYKFRILYLLLFLSTDFIWIFMCSVFFLDCACIAKLGEGSDDVGSDASLKAVGLHV
jgi:hypothetical protein